ncbi:CRISPR-associated helicase Cas3' [[Eubacterium] hominis]|uniref:CRISPR-associated helicase Cas3' n=1 Tax=[Eubacterium] hominis TaxID=2764325 RepID=UPI0022E26A4D
MKFTQKKDDKVSHLAINNEGERAQPLYEHNTHTKQLAKKFGQKLNCENICSIAGELHDIGKSQKAFQIYIRKAAAGEFVQKGSINHSSAGAKYIMDTFAKSDNPFVILTAEIIAEAIISHHGLKDFISPDGDLKFQKSCYSEKYDEKEISEYIQEMLDEIKIKDDIEKAVEELQVLYEAIYERIPDGEYKDDELGFDISAIIRYVLSCVIAADREDTRMFMLNETPLIEIDVNLVWKNAINKLEQLISTFSQEGELNKLRMEISRQCYIAASRQPGIYRLSCPTGSGKTLSSLRFALHHAHKYQKKHIFYIAPYKSILTQNSDVMKQFFCKDDVLIHHSDFIPEDQEKYLYLNSNWSSPFIMTTAVQFYQTLFSNNTTSIRRFHQLSDSVIIIDEAQTIPTHMISMFNYMINFLSEVCHSTIVLCTATQPVFEKTKRQMRIYADNGIIQDELQQSDVFKRVHYVNKCTPKGFDYDEYADFIMDCWKKHNSVLTIVNTKKDAMELYKKCLSLNEEMNMNVSIYHLSTNMCPVHRNKVLQEIKDKLIANEPLICISTNLIEAGIDLSFSSVIRSITGLDSIIQAAGRCNRNGDEQYGYVYLVKPDKENINSLIEVKEGKMVTQSLLDYIESNDAYIDSILDTNIINRYYEKLYFNSSINMDYMINKPFKETQINLWSGLHKGLEEAVSNGNENLPHITSALRSAGEQFKVMEQTIGILVPYEEKGRELIAFFNGNHPDKEKYERLKEAQGYTVQVYEQKYRQLMEAGLVDCLPFGEILTLKEGYYDLQVGLMIDKELEDMFL